MAAGHAVRRGLPGRALHRAQARGRAAPHGRSPGRGARHLRARRRRRRDVRRAPGGDRAARAALPRGRGRLQRDVLGAAGRRGASRRPSTAHDRRHHARPGTRACWAPCGAGLGADLGGRRRVHGSAAPRAPRALRAWPTRTTSPTRSVTAPTAPSPARWTTASPSAVIEEVRAAGLAGRGGAYFQTAVKWAGCRAAAGSPKYLVVNGEEGEPGIFKDRHLMEGDPHRLLEGVLLAAFAAGASRAILYIHGEADLSADATSAWRSSRRGRGGWSASTCWAPTFSLEVEIRRGAGGFVLGEETALLESIEGQRAMPRTRPPFPVESGLFGKPTVINNVETLCAVPSIVERGGAWFAGLGRRPRHEALRSLGLVRRPGVVEMEVGCTLRTLIDDVGGGSASGRPHPRGRRGRAVGQRRPSPPVRRAAHSPRPRQSRHRRRRRARRHAARPGGGARADRLQHARVVRQVHALPRGHGAPAGHARRPSSTYPV